MGILTDILLVSFLIFQTYMGWRSGLLWQAVAMGAVGFSVVLGSALAPALGMRLLGSVTSDPFHAKLIGFLFVSGSVALLLRLAATWAEHQAEQGLPRKEQEIRRGQDRILGGIFGALKASVIALVAAASLVSLWPRQSVWTESKLVPPLAVAGARLLPEGAIQELHVWLETSAQEVGRGLKIKPAGQRAEEVEEEGALREASAP